MKIVDKSKVPVKFWDLEIGDIFKFQDLYCIKTENKTDNHGSVMCNAVDIEGGELFALSGFDKVQKVNATLIIGGEEE